MDKTDSFRFADSGHKGQSFGSRSLVNATLRTIALLIALTITIMTLAAYRFIGQLTEKRELAYLQEHVSERVQLERQIFHLVEQNQAAIKADMIQQLKAMGQTDPAEEFHRLFKQYPDGVWRMHTPAKKGDKVTTAYIDDSLEINADIRRRMVVFEHLVGKYGPVWNHLFPNLYIFSESDNMEAQYWPENADWDYIIGPDYDMSKEEWAYVSNKTHDPERQAIWTGLYWDDVAKIWMVSCSTPVDIDGRHIGSIGQDIYLSDLVERSIYHCLEGTQNIIFRADGRLIAHRDKMNEVQTQERVFNIPEFGDERLQRIFKTVMNHPEASIIELDKDDLYLAVGKISEPEWYFVIAYPRQIIFKTAFKSSMVVLLLGLGLLVIELVIIYLVLKFKVGTPLNELTHATIRIANRESDVRLPTDRDDEFGHLADTFNHMMTQIETLISGLQTRIQQKQLAENALKQSQDELQTLMDASPMAVSWADTNGNIRYSNRKFIELFGYTLEEMPTIEDWSERAYPDADYREQVARQWEQAVEGTVKHSTDIRMEVLITCKDGQVRYTEVIGTILRDRIFVIFNDLTERKRQETERERLLKLLKDKNDELQSIVYVSSHDLRSPLVNIEGFCSELSNDCDQMTELISQVLSPIPHHEEIAQLLNQSIPQSLDFIKSSTVKMEQLLNGLLQVSRIGSVEINIVPLEMNKLIFDVIQCMQFQINEVGAKIEVEPLPGCLADASQINQVFTNLLQNSIKYRHPDRPLEIRITGRVVNSESCYSVTDNGIGIDPKYHSKIFEIFHRLNPEGDTDSQGLGLTIVKRILDRHNGSITVESTPNEETRFIISLPTTQQ